MNLGQNKSRNSSSHKMKSVEDLLNQSMAMSQDVQNTISQALAGTTAQRSPSPVRKSTDSPKQSKHSKSDTHLSPSFTPEKAENVEECSSHSLDSSGSQNQTSRSKESLDALDGAVKKHPSKQAERAKKKAWYNVLYPSYKSRSEDFKKLFKDVPDDERLIVDYSCAIQKDILVHGRLYVSQNYLCFYSNLIVWETRMAIKWTSVTAITKEKTARVIPNAILVCTENEKHFLTSFTSRDKTYLMLFRVWQNALMDKPMNPQEMWQWVHFCYGDELGLTSDDEDYIDPYEGKGEIESLILEGIILEDPCIGESQIEVSATSSDNSKEIQINGKEKKVKKITVSKIISLSTGKLDQRTKDEDQKIDQLPTDMSDSTDSEQGKTTMSYVNQTECTSLHEGRQLVHTVLPIHIDTLFQLLFEKSQFYLDFHDSRKTTDLVQGEWIINEEGQKQRVCSLTIAITQTVGPKSAQVTETQLMRPESMAGQLYSIDVSSVNAGIPYADSFYVCMHYCITRTTENNSLFSVHAQIKYKKSVWGVVKGFIEKNTWAGLEEYFLALLRALQSEYCIAPIKVKRRKGRGSVPQQKIIDKILPLPTLKQKLKSEVISKNIIIRNRTFRDKLPWIVIILLLLLIVVNVILFLRLIYLEEETYSERYPDFTLLKDPPQTHEEWLKLLQQQQTLHAQEMLKWQKVLQIAVELLKKTEGTLLDLQQLIHIQRFSSSKTATDDLKPNINN